MCVCQTEGNGVHFSFFLVLQFFANHLVSKKAFNEYVIVWLVQIIIVGNNLKFFIQALHRSPGTLLSRCHITVPVL